MCFEQRIETLPERPPRRLQRLVVRVVARLRVDGRQVGAAAAQDHAGAPLGPHRAIGGLRVSVVNGHAHVHFVGDVERQPEPDGDPRPRHLERLLGGRHGVHRLGGRPRLGLERLGLSVALRRALAQVLRLGDPLGQRRALGP